LKESNCVFGSENSFFDLFAQRLAINKLHGSTEKTEYVPTNTPIRNEREVKNQIKEAGYDENEARIILTFAVKNQLKENANSDSTIAIDSSEITIDNKAVNGAIEKFQSSRDKFLKLESRANLPGRATIVSDANEVSEVTSTKTFSETELSNSMIYTDTRGHQSGLDTRYYYKTKKHSRIPFIALAVFVAGLVYWAKSQKFSLPSPDSKPSTPIVENLRLELKYPETGKVFYFKKRQNINFNWTLNTKDALQRILISKEPDFSSTMVDENIRKTSYVLRNLNYEDTYYWKVTAVRGKSTKSSRGFFHFG